MLFLVFSLIIPCFIDGFAQYRLNVPSNNLYRIITETLAGAGISIFFSYLLY